MKTLVLLLLGIGAMAFGVWLSIFVMFVPGLTDIISQYQAETVSAPILAMAVTKIIFGWPVMAFCIGLAGAIWKEASK